MIKKICIRIRLIIRCTLNWLEKRHDALEVILLAITIFIAIVLYVETKEQVKIAHKALEHQRIADSSNSVDQRTAMQPFLYIDTVWSIQDFVSKRIPHVSYRIKNFGMTPAYNVLPMTNVIWESEVQKDTSSKTVYINDSLGFIVGRDGSLGGLTAWYYGMKAAFTVNDSITFWSKAKSLLFISTVIYEDAFGEPHYTQQGYILSHKSYPNFVGLRKYTRTDHNEKKQTTTQAH